jgi:hypothetical protein
MEESLEGGSHTKSHDLDRGRTAKGGGVQEIRSNQVRPHERTKVVVVGGLGERTKDHRAP